MPEISSSEWEAFLSAHPRAHLLQTSEWGVLKSAFGWQAAWVQCARGESGAQVLFRRLPGGLNLAYIPKGPVGGDPRLQFPTRWAELWPEIDALCVRRRALFLKVEPDLWEGEDLPGDISCPALRFLPSPQSIQPRRTLRIDIDSGEEAILMRMKQKTRYNIRLAQKKGVVVHPSDNLDLFHRLMQMTGERDAFGVHSLDYYRRVYALYHPLNMCELLIAEYEGEPLAGLMVLGRGERAWYFYGASSNVQRERMPTYLLQWEAIRWARAQGCCEYDLWGVPDADEDELEANFEQRSQGLWGVYRFKRGFGGKLSRSQGPWDRVYNPLLYRLYGWWASRRSSPDV